mmetsp:Transcript_12198/g.21170  ORF Transcript_12198/g.21170 Transcript_12198/m.21170 type:complete len:366 (-) Transcript_12198:372-1469(-)|eukprot:CAMPEP_0196652838 /NCGR_PEP_ID=MMETSP1086-20130531/2269_1 /TAXON_ID=77921 /ORGANISM="Cyanoptyche  gloeocystis , Strain SAG4.97" /LENGTH=365 /DNA_ID=CAMNT_0041983633 /DNA_START=129 /DNA_END=1226 /DNA_ORIENTATION=+
MAFISNVAVSLNAAAPSKSVAEACLQVPSHRQFASFNGFRKVDTVGKAVTQKSEVIFSVQASQESAVQKVVEFVKNAATKSAIAGVAAAIALAAVSQPVYAIEAKSFDELKSMTYLQMKGTGLANTCPSLPNSARDTITLDSSNKYWISDLCLQPTEIQVKAETGFKGAEAEYQNTRLMTRQTYTLDAIEGPIFIGSDGRITFEEQDGIDYAATTVKLPGGELVPFLFNIKSLVAKVDAASGASFTPSTELSGSFKTPSYRLGTFLDPKGRGLATGYDFAIALPASDQDEIAKENDKKVGLSDGNIKFQVVRVDKETGEIGGIFQSIQPSDTDLGAKVPKEVKINGVFYARINDGVYPGNPNASK